MPVEWAKSDTELLRKRGIRGILLIDDGSPDQTISDQTIFSLMTTFAAGQSQNSKIQMAFNFVVSLKS